MIGSIGIIAIGVPWFIGYVGSYLLPSSVNLLQQAFHDHLNTFSQINNLNVQCEISIQDYKRGIWTSSAHARLYCSYQVKTKKIIKPQITDKEKPQTFEISLPVKIHHGPVIKLTSDLAKNTYHYGLWLLEIKYRVSQIEKYLLQPLVTIREKDGSLLHYIGLVNFIGQSEHQVYLKSISLMHEDFSLSVNNGYLNFNDKGRNKPFALYLQFNQINANLTSWERASIDSITYQWYAHGKLSDQNYHRLNFHKINYQNDAYDLEMRKLSIDTQWFEILGKLYHEALLEFELLHYKDQYFGPGKINYFIDPVLPQLKLIQAYFIQHKLNLQVLPAVLSNFILYVYHQFEFSLNEFHIKAFANEWYITKTLLDKRQIKNQFTLKSLMDIIFNENKPFDDFKYKSNN